MSQFDAIVVGAGPNGLGAAIYLAEQGAKVLVLEASETPGGGMRTKELTLPGYHHDVCSAAHPLGAVSPFFRTLPLEEHGLQWLHPPASVAHPLDDGPAIIQSRSLEETADSIGKDGQAWRRMFTPFLKDPQTFIADALGPLRIPKHPFKLALFGMQAMWPATWYTKLRFRTHRGRALFAGHAAHSIIPLSYPFSTAVGMLLAMSGHIVDWPMPKGGSQRITDALVGYFTSLGGELQTSTKITDLGQLPDARVVLFDTDPTQLIDIAKDQLPKGYTKRLQAYRYGPGTFKLDYALDGPIPWKDPACLNASTVHIGGTIEEIAASERAAWRGEHHTKPFVMVCQQSQFDPGRAPEGKHTGYAYCHVPNGSEVDMTEAIESQIERFAPGFKARILKRHKMNTKAFSLYNPNYVGGAITGGAADMFQLFTRPVARLDPYSTPHKRLLLCSHSTPPGGGVHGMCGYFAAKSALRRLEKETIQPFGSTPTKGSST